MPACRSIPDASRLAFADPEFLLRRETRGIRFQLELLKPDLEQQAHGIENTIVVFGSARFRDTEASAAMVQAAETSATRPPVRRRARSPRNAHYYEKSRAFGRLVGRVQRRQGAARHAVRLHRRRPRHHGGGQPRRPRRPTASASACRSRCPMEEAANLYVTPALSFKFHYFALRKMHFMMRAKALVAFPRRLRHRWTSCSR
jgi:hypothetical protein